MEYPKAIMSRKELMEMGFSRHYLNRAASMKGQTFAFRLNPNNKCSPLLFDTAGLEKFRIAEIRAAERAAELKTGVM